MHLNAIPIDGSSSRSDRALLDATRSPSHGRMTDRGSQRWRNVPQSQVAVASIAAIIVASSSVSGWQCVGLTGFEPATT
jgi:hypothetical protein